MTEQLDQLTVFKASELRKQGYKDVGFVLQNEYGRIGVVAHAAVRWLHTPDEFFAFMHPDESQAQQPARNMLRPPRIEIPSAMIGPYRNDVPEVATWNPTPELQAEIKEYFQSQKGQITNATKILQSQAQQPEYTFDQLTKLLMQAATKEGHTVTMKIKWAQTPAPEGG